MYTKLLIFLEEIMSKGSRKREANALRQQQKLEREKFEAKKRKVRTVTAIVTIAVVLCLVLTVLAGALINNIRLNRGAYLRNEIAAASTNIDVDGAMMNYYFNSIYNNVLAQYGSYITYYGLDPSISLKQQTFSGTQTWFDYLMDGAKDNTKNLLQLNEAAGANGVALTDAEKAAIRTRADETNASLYGRGTKKNDIYNAMLIEALAYKYQLINQNSFLPSADEIDDYYAENTKNYQYVDYYSYAVTYIKDGSAAEADNVKALDDTKAYADKLAAATTAEEFKEAVREILTAQNPDITEEEITAKLDSVVSEKVAYVKDDAALEWAFTAKVNDTYTAENTETSTFTVYLLTKEAYRDESATINVRHVLLYDDDYGSRAKALKAAEKLLADFNAGDKTEEAFGLIALEYSQDPGSCYTGGLYENVASGQMVESFDKWCFDPARQAGDTGIVESDYGVHIMYFVGDGGEMWAAQVKSDMITEDLTELTADWDEKYPVVFDEEVLETIPA